MSAGPIPWALEEGCAVEIVGGDLKASRGTIVGPTHYRFGTIPVHEVRLETGRVTKLREDFLRRIA